MKNLLLAKYTEQTRFDDDCTFWYDDGYDRDRNGNYRRVNRSGDGCLPPECWFCIICVAGVYFGWFEECI